METAIKSVDSQTEKQCLRILSNLVETVPHVSGALLASADGHALASHFDSQEPRSTAAIVASSLGLGQRLSDLVGPQPLEELVVRSKGGYVVIYSIGDRGAVIVLAEPAVNLAMLHLRAKDVTKELEAAIDDG